MKESRSEFVDARGVRLHVRRWGSPDAPMLFMLHGWMDMSASFQFVVDALAGDWQVLAPDARGFGLSDWPVAQKGGGHYYFPDYLADLDVLLDQFARGVQVNLAGHSMGANVALLYAGVRPERVRRVVDLEGFGLPAARASQSPGRIAQWLDDLRAPPALRSYAGLDEVADRLIRTNPRLPLARARYLAQHWSREQSDGRFHLLADPQTINAELPDHFYSKLGFPPRITSPSFSVLQPSAWLRNRRQDRSGAACRKYRVRDVWMAQNRSRAKCLSRTFGQVRSIRLLISVRSSPTH